MRVVIAGGGTGGHLFPGLALAEEFSRRGRAEDVLFVGTRKGLEERVVPAAGYALRFLRVEGMVNRGILRALRSLLKIPGALRESRRILAAFDPHVVIGVGGYASGPVVAMAAWMGFPTLIHEQNAVPGLTNRILGRMVDRVALTYPDATEAFPARKVRLTGNPVRRSMGRLDRKTARRRLGLDPDRFTVLVMGGSLGARSLNRATVEALRGHPDLAARIQLLHQTGESDLEGVRAAYRELGLRGVVAAFFQAMSEAYAAADLVVCRAGASTLSELTACGRAALVVPYPHAAGNHQERNAQGLVDLGACRMIPDEELNGGSLAAEILALEGDPEERAAMERAARSVGRPDAAQRVAELAQGLCRQKGVL